MEKLLNTPIESIGIYHSNYLNIVKFKKNELGYYFKLCYKNIENRLANPTGHSPIPKRIAVKSIEHRKIVVPFMMFIFPP